MTSPVGAVGGATAAPRVRASTAEDRPAIAALLDRLLGAQPLDERIRLWDWRSRDNPARSDALPEFVVVDRGGEILGAHGIFPVRVQLGERAIVALFACDFAVDPAVRASGAPLKIAAMSPRLAPLSLSTTANTAAARLTLALGGGEVAVGRNALLLPLRSAPFLRTRLAARVGEASARLLAPAAGAAADVALAVRRVLAGARSGSAAGRLVPVAHFDARFDALWRELAPRSLVQVVRDAAYLNWRYARYPIAGIESLALELPGGELGGYVVTQRFRDEDGLVGLAILELVAAPRAARSASLTLLRAALQRARRERAAYVTLKSEAPSVVDAARALGFLVRSSDVSGTTYRTTDLALKELCASANGRDADAGWVVSWGDGDAFFRPTEQAARRAR